MIPVFCQKLYFKTHFYCYNQLHRKASLDDVNNSHSFHTLGKKATIHQLTTMLSIFKNVIFPGHNHLLNTGTDD